MIIIDIAIDKTKKSASHSVSEAGKIGWFCEKYKHIIEKFIKALKENGIINKMLNINFLYFKYIKSKIFDSSNMKTLH